MPSSPNQVSRYRQLPPTAYAGWDRVWQVESVLNEHDRGSFQRSAMLYDALMRDPRIAGVMDTRVGSLLASSISARPASAKQKAARLAREIQGDDDNPGKWDQLFPGDVIRNFTEYGTAVGVAVAEIVWYSDAGRWLPRLEVFHPQALTWDPYIRRFRLSTMDAQVILPDITKTPRSDGRWVIWCPRGQQFGRFGALVRRLALPYIMRGWDQRDWSRYNEKHGMPIIGAVTPGGEGDEVLEHFVQQLANLGNESVVELPQDAEGKGYDLKMIEAVGLGWQSFKEFKAALDADIAIAMLGQNLTTEVGGGSLAASEVHERVALDRRKEDAALARCLREQCLTWWALHNFGDPELAPVVTYDVVPPADETKEAAGLKGLGDGVQSLQTASGNIVDVRAIFDEWGIPMLSEEEVAAKKAQAVEEAQQAMGDGAAGGGDEGDGSGSDASNEGAKPERPGTPPRPGGTALSAANAGLAKRYQFQGLDIAVEHPAGSIRIWQTENAAVIGSTKMLHDYGYIEGVMGSDGEEVDVYVGPDETAADVHIVHQKKSPDYKAHDEDKVFLGFADATSAKAAFLAHRHDGDQSYGGMSVIPVERFRAKLKRRTGTGKIRARALDDAAAAALEALVARAGATALGSRGAAGNRRAKLYSDNVAARAVKMASAALAGDLAGMKAEIDQATSFEDLKARIVRRYREEMDPAALAAVVAKANILAHLGGRVTAIKQL